MLFTPTVLCAAEVYGRFTLKAADLGLKTGETIAVHFGLMAYPAQTILNSKP